MTWRNQTSWLNGSLGMLRRDFALPAAAGEVAHATLFASTIGFQELYRPGLPGVVKLPSRFFLFIITRFCLALLYGHAGRLTGKTGGFRPRRAVNGALLGEQRRYLYEPGQSAYYYRALVTTVNVTAQLRVQRRAAAGAGTLGAQLGNGPCSVLGKGQAGAGDETTASSTPSDCHDYGDVTMLCCKRGKLSRGRYCH